jgi:hypothetical protein
MSSTGDLRRWGHTSVSTSSRGIVVFGGFGADQNNNNSGLTSDTNKQKKKKNAFESKRCVDARLNSVAVLAVSARDSSFASQWVFPETCGDSPCARVHHSACVAQLSHADAPAAAESMVVFGGRTNPLNALGDVGALNLATWQWRALDAQGQKPPGLHRHSAVMVSATRMLVYGGHSSEQRSSTDVYCLDLDTCTWHRWALEEGAVCTPPALHSHRACVVGQHMLIFGGYSEGAAAHNPCSSTVFRLDLAPLTEHTDLALVRPSNLVWTAFSLMPLPLYSFALVSVTASDSSEHVVLIGGATQDHMSSSSHAFESPLCALDVAANEWYFPKCTSMATRQPVSLGSWALLLKHSSTFYQLPKAERKGCCVGAVALSGGGANCFSFGSTFSPSLRLECSWSVQQGEASNPRIEFAASRVCSTPEKQLLEETLARPSASPTVIGQGHPCSVCGELFSSRNKLYKHVTLMNHRRR